MIRVTYVATRELTSLHSIGDAVTLEFAAQEPLIEGRQVSRDQQIAIGGARETLHHFGLRTWNVTTEPLSGADLEAVVEFLASCEGGEPFTFEPWRYESGPSLDLDFTASRFRVAEEIQCEISSEGFSKSLFIGVGVAGGDDWWTVNFTVIEQP